MEFKVRIFCCGFQDCGKEYMTRQNLARHVNVIHKLQKRSLCEVCGKEFINKTNLKEHFYIHTGEKPYKCGICSQRFRHKSKLGSHTRMHVGGIFMIKTKEVEKNLDNFNNFI